MNMRIFLAAVLASLMALPVAADESEASELTKLMTAYDVRGWEAVGRLNIGWGGMCTGALIAPNIVLTAGHCLFDKETGEILHEASLPLPPAGTPMTYMVNEKQYISIAVGGGQDSRLVTLALP